jgi:hypothetical protein
MAGKREFGTVRKLPSGLFQARYTGPDGIRYSARSAEGRPLTFSGRLYAAAWLSCTDTEIQADCRQPQDQERVTDLPVTLRAYSEHGWPAGTCPSRPGPCTRPL